MTELKWKQPKARELLGGDLLAQSLAQLGASVAFGLHGGHLDAFLIGCDLAGIKLVDTRHETVAVQAAEGYAKLSGKVGLCFVTANSGFSNGLPGLATAFADRSPIFCITSSPPLRDAETNSLQGFHDQVVLSKPITKFTHRVTNVEEIPRIVAYAWRSAHTGIPGPVVVDFPIDVLFSPPRSLSAISHGAVMMGPSSLPAPDPAALAKLAEMWRCASRPVIITGTGASRIGALGTKSNPLLQLAEATSTPVFASQKFVPSLPQSCDFKCGPASLLAGLFVSKQPTPDLVILLGARTGFLLGGRSGAIIPRASQIVQIDLDGAEIGKSLPITLGIVSDSGLFISAFLEHIKSDSLPRHSEWISTCTSLKTLPSPHEKDPTTQADGAMHPYHAVKALYKSLPEDTIIIIDGGEAGVWAMDLLSHAPYAHALVSTGYLGFLGNGYGYALGASLAYPTHQILLLHGDGSAGFHIAELDTYARFSLRILTVIMNNHHWGMSIAGQDLIYTDSETVRPASKLSKDCKFEVVAQGFNCRGVKVERVEDVGSAVEEAIGKGEGPGVVNMIVSRYPVTSTTKGMVGKPEKGREGDVIVVPYYDNVPRPFYRDEVKMNGA